MASSSPLNHERTTALGLVHQDALLKASPSLHRSSWIGISGKLNQSQSQMCGEFNSNLRLIKCPKIGNNSE